MRGGIKGFLLFRIFVVEMDPKWLTAFIQLAGTTTTRSRVARFFLVQHTKAGKMYQITINNTQLPQNTYTR
jgi:hypothetical protein